MLGWFRRLWPSRPWLPEHLAGLLPIAIWRGFLASGISRTRSIWSKPVLQARARHLHIIGKLEAAFEGARCDALMQDLALGVLAGLLLAPHRQRVFLAFDGEIVLAEAGYGDGDAIGVFRGPLDIIGRVARRVVDGGRLVEQREQTVEADGRAIERRKIKVTHNVLQRSDRSAPACLVMSAGPFRFAQPVGLRRHDLGARFRLFKRSRRRP